ncbi:hypothetical protein DPEC_G00059880 [Dallia pectoralis]|uniref:Uncharacterized protein n=1 Tax=Dallia pectoralis TaxID=75939 RepID=A0ACC2H763_DALPE|nr:hypothetical protein DPEC_G00059880 [Dallia pectoralis]
MAQMRAPVIALLVVLAVGLFANSEAQQGCCMSYSSGRRIVINRIRGYSIQTMKQRCNINAIIFHLVNSRNVCVDPSQGWVMENIRNLREKAIQLNTRKSPAN